MIFNLCPKSVRYGSEIRWNISFSKQPQVLQLVYLPNNTLYKRIKA